MNCFCCCQNPEDWPWEADLVQRRVCCYRGTCKVWHCSIGFCVPPVDRKGRCRCTASWIWFFTFSPLFLSFWTFGLVAAVVMFVVETIVFVPYRLLCNRPDPLCAARIRTVSDRLVRQRLYPERPMTCLDWIYPGGDRTVDLESAVTVEV